MSLLSDLTVLAGDAFEKAGLDRRFGEVTVSQRPELGQFQCNGALAAAKTAGRSPRDIAADVAALMAADPIVAGTEVAGPGFINVTLTGEHLAGVLASLAADDRLGVAPVAAPRRVVVDYGGPNVAKDLHVGHVRVALIGESLKRVLRFVGHDAIGDVHLGDWGAPMGQLIAEMEDRSPDLPYFDPNLTGGYPDVSPVSIDDLQDMYPVAAAKVKDDPDFAARTRFATVALQDGRPGYRALWEHFRAVSVSALEEVYDLLDVSFDLWLGESSVHDRVAPLLERLRSEGVARESDGALVVEVAEPGDRHEIPPLMLANSRGGFTYAATDLATVEERVEDLGAQELLYIVDLRQSLHFEQLFRAARKGHVAGPDIVMVHAGNGTVNGPNGRPFKTREGGIPRLREVIADAVAKARERIDESELGAGYPEAERSEIAHLVGLAALKYGELSNHRTSDYSFDLERFSQLHGRTGPYIQYVTTRCSSILVKAAAIGAEAGRPIPPVHESERRLILELSRLPEVIHRCLDQWAPNHLAEYAYEVAGQFNRFYDSCHILSEPTEDRQRSWLALVATTHRLLVIVLGLLGIAVPHRM
jgi:arginyl-tRNA synthetase